MSSKTEEKDEEADATADLLQNLKVEPKTDKVDVPEETNTGTKAA